MEEIEDIKRRVVKHPKADELYIARLPKNIKEYILEIANEHCCGDYGWALSLIIGPVQEQNKTIMAMLSDVFERIDNLEEKEKPTTEPEKDNKKGRGRFKGE